MLWPTPQTRQHHPQFHREDGPSFFHTRVLYNWCRRSSVTLGCLMRMTSAILGVLSNTHGPRCCVRAFPSYLFILNGHFMCHPVSLALHGATSQPRFQSAPPAAGSTAGQVPLPGCSSASFCSLWDNKSFSYAPSPDPLLSGVCGQYKWYSLSKNQVQSLALPLDTGPHHSEPQFSPHPDGIVTVGVFLHRASRR